MKEGQQQFLDMMLYSFDKYQQWLDCQLEIHVRNNAKPKIKGDITKGKMTWRGLYVCSNHINETWIEQRGESITPKFSLDIYKKTLKD